MLSDRLLTRLTQIPGVRTLWRRLPFGSVDTRVRFGIFDQPHYAYGVYAAADLARRLGLHEISAIELGVAGGKGLLGLERLADVVGTHLGIRVLVAGFDTGRGMPPPTDYRDLPHVWGEGFYDMDVPKLRAVLSPKTELILGDVGDTLQAWTPKAPVGFVAFDLDYYSSTAKALRLFADREPSTRLPRVYCYFDDTIWPEHACYNDYVGELCAIREFNEHHHRKKICPIHMLRHTRVHQAAWNDAIYVFHDFDHPLYTTNVTSTGVRHTQLPL
jgi:hypothetical protein